MAITARTDTFMNKDEFGRWANKLQRQANGALDDMVDDGIRTARAIAPRGDRSRPARPGHTPFKDSIIPYQYSGGQEKGWATTARHFWWYVRGTAPHLIIGKLVFFWDNVGDWFVWNHPRFGPYGSGKRYENWDPLRGAMVKHPGTRPHPNWLLTSFRVVAERAPTYLRRRMG